LGSAGILRFHLPPTPGRRGALRRPAPTNSSQHSISGQAPLLGLPGYRTHYEQTGYSVSHYLVVVGYDQDGTFVLNDPGISKGHGWHIKYDQLMHAIDDLDHAYPNLNAGWVFLVLAPFSNSGA
jgi:hypothetical protein